MKLPDELHLLKNFGRVRYTSDDFLGLIRSCKIEYVLSTDVKKGRYYYCAHTRKHVIEVSANIARSEREQVGWHEFGHVLQNWLNPRPMSANYCKPEGRNKRERFADLFAFVCVTGLPMCGRLDFIKTLMSWDPEDM